MNDCTVLNIMHISCAEGQRLLPVQIPAIYAACRAYIAPYGNAGEQVCGLECAMIYYAVCVPVKAYACTASKPAVVYAIPAGAPWASWRGLICHYLCSGWAELNAAYSCECAKSSGDIDYDFRRGRTIYDSISYSRSE